MMQKADIKLENFKDAWSLGDPVAVEKKFHALLSYCWRIIDEVIADHKQNTWGTFSNVIYF